MNKEAKKWMDNLEKEFGINIVNKDEVEKSEGKIKDIPGFEGTLEKLNDITIMCSKELDNEWANESENPQ